MQRAQSGINAQSLAGDPANFDEMTDASGAVRPAYTDYCGWLGDQDAASLKRKSAEADESFRRTGITFNVYGPAGADLESRRILDKILSTILEKIRLVKLHYLNE